MKPLNINIDDIFEDKSEQDEISQEDRQFHIVCNERFSGLRGEEFATALYNRFAKESCLDDCPNKTAYKLGRKELVEALVRFSRINFKD